MSQRLPKKILIAKHALDSQNISDETRAFYKGLIAGWESARPKPEPQISPALRKTMAFVLGKEEGAQLCGEAQKKADPNPDSDRMYQIYSKNEWEAWGFNSFRDYCCWLGRTND